MSIKYSREEIISFRSKDQEKLFQSILKMNYECQNAELEAGILNRPDEIKSSEQIIEDSIAQALDVSTKIKKQMTKQYDEEQTPVRKPESPAEPF